VVLHGHPETTVDVDVLASLEVTNTERLAAALRDVGARHPRSGAVPGPGRLVGLRQVLSFDTTARRLDVHPAASGLGAYDDVAPRAQRVDLGGFTALVATLDDVITSRRLPAAGRTCAGSRAFALSVAFSTSAATTTAEARRVAANSVAVQTERLERITPRRVAPPAREPRRLDRHDAPGEDDSALESLEVVGERHPVHDRTDVVRTALRAQAGECPFGVDPAVVVH
jgi:hypothetical protein